MLLAVRGDGGPFTAWPSVFTRASDRVRDWYEPRFPHVHPHRLRHTFAVRTLERLVGGHYALAARLAAEAGHGGALALYLSRADPMMVLRDLLGHSSVLTTEKYLHRLDMTRIYQEARQGAGGGGRHAVQAAGAGVSG
jgi:integrase